MKKKHSTSKAIHSILPSFFHPSRKIKYSGLSNQKGYSLIEILIAFALVAILATIAVPQTNGWIEHYRLTGAARLVWGDLQSAKMTAIKSNQSVTVTLNSTTKTSYSFSQGGNTIFTRDLTQDYPRITVVKSEGDPIIFTSTGMTQYPADATITVQGPRETKSITTKWTGRIIQS